MLSLFATATDIRCFLVGGIEAVLSLPAINLLVIFHSELDTSDCCCNFFSEPNGKGFQVFFSLGILYPAIPFTAEDGG